MASFKVQVRNNIVYDRVSAIDRIDQILVNLGSETPAHQIVAPLKGHRALLFRAREVAPVSDSPSPVPGEPPARLRATKLFSTSENPRSWGQANYESRNPKPDDPNNTPGPVCVGVAVEESGASPPPSPMGPQHPPLKSTPVAVVLGDATFISNPWLIQFPPNQDLFLNSVNWLGGRITDIGIQPRKPKYQRLELDNAGYYTIVFEPFFHLLAIAAFLAGLVWVVRADRYQLLWLPVGGTLVLVALYAGLAAWLIGSLTRGPGRVTVMRLLLTCCILWSVGLSFWLARMRPARKTETA